MILGNFICVSWTQFCWLFKSREPPRLYYFLLVEAKGASFQPIVSKFLAETRLVIIAAVVLDAGWAVAMTVFWGNYVVLGQVHLLEHWVRAQTFFFSPCKMVLLARHWALARVFATESELTYVWKILCDVWRMKSHSGYALALVVRIDVTPFMHELFEFHVLSRFHLTIAVSSPVVLFVFSFFALEVPVVLSCAFKYLSCGRSLSRDN